MRASKNVRKKSAGKIRKKAKTTTVTGVAKRIALATPRHWKK